MFARDEMQHLCELELTISTENDFYGSSIIVVAVGKGVLLVRPFTVHRFIFGRADICQFDFVVVYSTYKYKIKAQMVQCTTRRKGWLK